MNTLSLLPVNLDLITDSPRWDIHPFLPPDIPADLAQSFKETSILHPPLLYAHDNGTYEILCGRKRLQAAREICHLSECICHVAPQATPPPALLSLIFESHRLSSPFSPMEIAYFFSVGLQYLPIQELVQTFLAQMTGKSGVSILKKYLQLPLLEKEIQRLVHSLFISEGMALDLLKIEPEDRICLSRLFQEFQLGGGKQKRLFLLLRDICRLNSISMAVFLAEPEIIGILRHKEMNAPQKIQQLFTHLQQLSTPSYQADEDSFRSEINQLKLPRFCEVRHSAAFETDEVILNITFASLELLRKSWPELHRALQKSSRQER